MEITHQLVMSFDGSKRVPVPDSLLQSHDGSQWLKLRPTSREILKLAAGKNHGVAKNVSLSNSQRLAELKHLRLEAMVALMDKQKDGEDEARQPDLFEEGSQPKAPKKLKLAHDGPQFVSIAVGGTPVDVLLASSRPQLSDLAVRVDPEALGAVFRYLQEDMAAPPGPRSYKRSGNFRKPAGTDNDEGQSD